MKTGKSNGKDGTGGDGSGGGAQKKKSKGEGGNVAVNAGCSIRVICSALDSAPCVVLSTDNQRILFDAGEGVQRMCVEHKVRLSKTDKICFTQISAHTVAGAPGLALTCADSGCPRLDLLGPPGLKNFWTSTASFTHRKQHVVQAVEVNSVVELDTGEVRLEAMPLIKHEKQSINPTVDESFNPHVIASPTHICYVCQTKSLPGRFDIQKARSLGVPVGPMCATLKSGQDVTLEDGTVVRSVDVIGASEPARFVAIICNISSPSEAASCSSSCNDSLLQMLVSDPYWTSFAPGGQRYGLLDCVVHYSGADITGNPEYRRWASQFNYQFDPSSLLDTAKIKKKGKKDIPPLGGVQQHPPCTVLRPVHLLLGKDNAGLQTAFLASTIYTRKLHSLFPNIFTPLSVLQRKESNINAEVLLSAQAMIRINSVEALRDISGDSDDLDDDTIVALGPPALIRNPNTTLLDAMTEQDAQEAKRIEKCDESSKGTAQIVELNEEAGSPGTTYTLLPKSSRGLTFAWSDDDVVRIVQQEVENLWNVSGDSSSNLESMVRQLEECHSVRKNVNALKGSSFLFAQSEEDSMEQEIVEDSEECDSLSDDSYCSGSPVRLARNFQQRKTPEKVQLSEHVNDASNSVRQDCLLLGASESAISFLGTGCAIPSKYRNVSGILLHLSAESSMLLDCGEGTWQQAVRMAREHPGMCNMANGRSSPIVSSSMAAQWLANTIKVVWISHPHADHHLGLMTLVAERKRHWKSNRKPFADAGTTADDFIPLLIIAPTSVLNFLASFTASDKLMKDSYIGIDNHAFEPEWANSSNKMKYKTFGYAKACGTTPSDKDRDGSNISTLGTSSSSSSLCPVDQQLLIDIGIQSLENVQVHHCSQSYGIRLQSTQGWSLVYSGDTRPCPQLVRLGKGATILIHEATFDDTKPEEAVKKRHTTISEAIKVAEDMNAHRLILTHFSQRYPSMPPLPENYQSLSCGLLLAFDFMSVKYSDLLWTHKMNPALLLAFPPDAAEEDIEMSTDALASHGNVDSRKRAIEQDSTADSISNTTKKQK